MKTFTKYCLLAAPVYGKWKGGQSEKEDEHASASLPLPNFHIPIQEQVQFLHMPWEPWGTQHTASRGGWMDTGNMSPQSAAICWICLKWQTPGVLGKQCSTVKHRSQKLHLRSYSMFSFFTSENQEIRACLGSAPSDISSTCQASPKEEPAGCTLPWLLHFAMTPARATGAVEVGGGQQNQALHPSTAPRYYHTFIPSPALLKGSLWLTTLVVLGDAPWCISCDTIFTCPMKAATWIGVRPDWKTHQRSIKMLISTYLYKTSWKKHKFF